MVKKQGPTDSHRPVDTLRLVGTREPQFPTQSRGTLSGVETTLVETTIWDTVYSG